MPIGLIAQQKAESVSYLEIYNIETGKITLVGEYDYNIQASNWSPNGNWLVINSQGKIYRIPVQGGEPILIPTGKCQNVNNDHVLTFDGKWSGISNNDKEVGSRIYIVPFPEGGEPRLATSRGLSYLRGISPDNKWIFHKLTYFSFLSFVTLNIRGDSLLLSTLDL